MLGCPPDHCQTNLGAHANTTTSTSTLYDFERQNIFSDSRIEWDVESEERFSEGGTKRGKTVAVHCKQQTTRMEEEVQALVIDNGSGMCKAGM